MEYWGMEYGMVWYGMEGITYKVSGSVQLSSWRAALFTSTQPTRLVMLMLQLTLQLTLAFTLTFPG